MREAVLEKPETIVFREVPEPVPGPGQALIRVRRIGICGSDIHAYYGKHPYISCPVVQGHEFSGEIVGLGERVTGMTIGEKVTVMPQLTCGICYPCTHGNYHICNALKVIGCQSEGAARELIAVDAGLIVKLPEDMSFEEGAMVEPIAVGVHAAGRLDEIRGKNILVLGAGPIGNLVAQACKGLGAASVLITDKSESRLAIARDCGLDFTVNPDRQDLAAALDIAFGPDRADAVFECVGAEATIAQAISLARKGTDIVVVGVFGAKPSVDIGLVQDKELRLLGSLMYRDEDYRTAIRLIREGRVKLDPLMSKHFPFKDYPLAYKFIEAHREEAMKVFIDL